MLSICIDIDNVIVRTDEVVREVIREHSRGSVDLAYEDVICFDYWRCRDKLGRKFDKSEWKRIHEEFTRNHLLRICSYENVGEHMNLISDKFDIYLATSRLETGREQTLEWLRSNEIP